MAKRKAAAPGLTHLRITLSEDFYVGPGRADLIEFIAETGSIREAAKRMGMSYKRAWGLVQALNEGFGAALVETQRGGTGQGASVTAAGHEVLGRYRNILQRTREVIATDIQALAKLQSDMSKRK